MFRRALLVTAISVSLAAMGLAQAGGAKGGASSSGSAGTAGATPSAPGAVSNPGIPMTQGAVGGLAGQAGAGTVALPGANQVGAPTVPETISGPAGTTGTTQGNPNSVNNTGTATSGFVGGFAGGVLATPTASFTAPQPTAGISLADRSGISSSTPVDTGVQTTLSPSTLIYTNVEPVNPMAVTTNPSALGGPIRDFGPSYYAGAASVGAVPPTMAAVSLGEVAAKLKAEKPTQNVRTYTNADVQRINENMNLQGVNVNARLQQTAQPDPGVTVASGQAASSGTRVANEPPAPAVNQPQLSASARPSPAIREEQAQSAPASSAPQPTQSAQESATTPQVNQPKPGSQSEQQPSRQLPATSTLLPLLGIIGLASGGIGLVFRKYRK